MFDNKKIKSALLSVFHKDGLDEIVRYLSDNGVKIYSTGGTLSFIEQLGVSAQSVENLTGYPSILGGRVKTLHPKVFGGILARRSNSDDSRQLEQYEIPEVDLVIVDLYPFEETVASGASEAEVIEKIDIGGISLIRAAAKNYSDVAIVASRRQYAELLSMLKENGGGTTSANRKYLAAQAFNVSSHYDSAIFSYFNRSEHIPSFKQSVHGAMPLRYGENPHQKAIFYGNFGDMFEQLHGKEISYNNLLDVDAAVRLIREFDAPTFAIIKHNNACGAASRPTLLQAWTAALAGDPVSAFGGVLACNRELDKATAEEVNKLFCEVVIAPAYSSDGLAILKQKKNRIILAAKTFELPAAQSRTLLNGVAVQEQDLSVETEQDMTSVTAAKPTAEQVQDLIFANKLVKHSKSNAIVLAKDSQLIAGGVGQTSRVDALRHAIEKAASFGFSLQGAVMASDAFFPFPDCVEIAHKAGIAAVIQPGGSVNDQKSVDYCNANGVAMVTTGVRHFKH
ncbi:MAG: bifunctional phosphoribosylaminoimidazolecarboxamide formyltransferase/IMP cyclohydrolase [Prevotellaceae bacterium]|jgi:phosphoribosylaminoimidazolecarboxamide formyltransferase/IMP cyclohydrolase|nr:bifunctional phosphoribosylaminoimidazolecarboxamide formyltransferase/IMP cyclohydrolase [Prevotellaceae bacterium]